MTARLFVEAGAQVVATDISGAQNETVAELGSSAVPFQAERADETLELLAGYLNRINNSGH
ncbi:hypothetical protein [Streptomyces sioyaensis]|uniref:hypothetical protein n=1 Tax=Streptomyces sioyaensis TaxID=67364 RepID=UPI003D7048CF